MRLRRCTRFIDARSRTGRVSIQLECRHNLMIKTPPDTAMPRNWVVGGDVMCPFCPDVTPEETRREMSATELYKRAGEP